MKIEDLIVGKKYKHKNGNFAFYAGKNEFGSPVFELEKHVGTTITIPKNYKYVASNTYWAYISLEREFSPVEEDLKSLEVKEQSSDELLAEAKRWYPIGTKFKSVYNSEGPFSEVEVVNTDFSYKDSYLDDYGYVIQNHKTGGWIYSSKKGWAEIISKPEIKESFPFEIEIINRKDNNWYKLGEKYTIYDSAIKNGELSYFNHPMERSYWISAKDTKKITTSNNSTKLDSLPEKWCIRALDNTQFSIIIPYFITKKSNYQNYEVTYPDNSYASDFSYETHIENHLKNGFVEIDINEFKKWVLKESHSEQIIDKMNDETPEYVAEKYPFKFNIGEEFVVDKDYIDIKDYISGDTVVVLGRSTAKYHVNLGDDKAYYRWKNLLTGKEFHTTENCIFTQNLIKITEEKSTTMQEISENTPHKGITVNNPIIDVLTLGNKPIVLSTVQPSLEPSPSFWKDPVYHYGIDLFSEVKQDKHLDIEYQDPVIVKSSKNKKSKLVII